MSHGRVAAGILSLAVLGTLPGCVNNLYPGGPTPNGGLFTSVTSPAQMLSVETNAATSTRRGQSTSSGFLGLVATGDAGLNAAMNNGGITKVHHVDHEVMSVLWGLYFQNTTIVHGE